jgi:hypothetical protein
MERECSTIIRLMINKIPKSKKKFLEELEWNYNDSCYKPPEETIQWVRTHDTLMRNIKLPPREDWEWEVLSIFTNKSVNELKEESKKYGK